MRAIHRLTRLLCCLALGACSGGGSKHGSDSDESTVPDAAQEMPPDDEDASAPDVEQDAGTGHDDAAPPALLPARIELTVDPGRAFYRPGQKVDVSAVAFDANDQPMPEVSLVVQALPASATTSEPVNRFVLGSEGVVTFRACIVDTQHCEETSLLVDAAAPVLEVTEPAPGAELGGDGATSIVVSGSVSDATYASVFVNGARVQPDELGAFTLSVAPSWGVNHLAVVASDGLSEETRQELDVLWADAYHPYSVVDGTLAPRTALEDAVRLQLGRGVFDDGAPLQSGTPLETRDLADLVELVLQHVDLQSALPDPLINAAPTLTLRVTDVRSEAVSASIDLVDDGAELFVRLGAVHVDTEGALTLEGSHVSLAGGIDLSVGALATLRIVKPSLDAPVEVTLESLSTAIESAQGRFDSAEANAVFKLAESTLRTALERELEKGFRSTLANTLPAVLGGALGALDTALRDRTITLDTGIFPTTNLLVDGRIRALETLHGRYLGALMQATLGSDRPVAHPASRGTALVAARPGSPLFESRPLELGVRMGLLNAVLHTLWNSGLLEVDVVPFLPEEFRGSVTRAFVHGGMAPVLLDSAADDTHDLRISVGQLELDLELGTLTRYGITMEAGVNVSVANNALVIHIADTPTLRTWLIARDPEAQALPPELLKVVLEGLVWPRLREAFADGLAIQLPSLSAAALGDIAPALANLTLSLQSMGGADVRGDTIVLDLGLFGRLP
jgi:hypothetical protein